MKKLAIILLSATMALASGAAFAEGADTGSNNGSANQSDSPGSVQKIAPNGVDNSKINETDKPVNEVHKKKHTSTTKAHKDMSKKQSTTKKPCVRTVVARIRFLAPISLKPPVTNFKNT